MKLIHRYVLSQLVRNFLLSLLGLTALFLIFDFFDRIDNIASEDASLLLTFEYFLCKTPSIINLMMPVAMLVATMLTVGLMSRNSEITAMRASGLKLTWIAKPIFILGLVLSVFSILFSETIVPAATRRSKEIYNIDIRRKDQTGAYSQSNIWWRSGRDFFSVTNFDSRSDSFHDLSKFELDENFEIVRRTDASRASWINEEYGWTMSGVSQYRFLPNSPMTIDKFEKLPLLIKDKPEDFYDIKSETETMSFRQLRKFIKQQSKNGIEVSPYYADLQAKISFPFVIAILTLVALPFSFKPARSGSMAASFVAGLVIGFSYYAVHSFSISLGRAELWPPMLAAWAANILMGFVGVVLNLGAESP